MITTCKFLTFTVFYLSFSMASSFAATIDFSIEERGKTVSQKAQVSKGRALVANAGDDPNQDLLFVESKRQLVIINHKSRSYMVINDQVIDEIAEISNSVGTVIESQKGVLGDLMSTFGLEQQEKKPRAEMKDAGRVLEINGFRCSLYQSFRDQQIDSELCMAENDQLKISTTDYNTLVEFMDFADNMLNRAGPLISALGLTLPQMSMPGARGLPIGMHSAKQQLKVRITGVDNSGGQGVNYNVPEGYSRSAVPFTSG